MATIVIDPGHTGGYNPGVCAGYYEGNTMLKLGRYLGDELTSMGANVIYTRTTNEENPSLAERGGRAVNADLFISMHSDAADNPNARGVTSYYSVQRPASEPFAASIGRAAANAMGNQFRGTIARPSTTNPALDYYGVLRAAVSVGARNAFLIEHGFHTNQQDCEILSNDNALRRIAAAEAMVIAEYFGLELGCRVYYTVQPMDSLYTIAQKFGTTWQRIAAANGILPPYVVTVGQQLIIPLPAESTEVGRFYYTVGAGDTLYTIARRFGITWQQIASANNISAPYGITVGQQLIIPLPGEECRFFYTVGNGETLYLIAQKFGTTWQQIAAANGILPPYIIRSGQRIIIPLRASRRSAGLIR